MIGNTRAGKPQIWKQSLHHEHEDFAQEQIDRAVEIGLGSESPEGIDVVAANEESKAYRDAVAAILDRG